MFLGSGTTSSSTQAAAHPGRSVGDPADAGGAREDKATEPGRHGSFQQHTGPGAVRLDEIRGAGRGDMWLVEGGRVDDRVRTMLMLPDERAVGDGFHRIGPLGACGPDLHPGVPNVP